MRIHASARPPTGLRVNLLRRPGETELLEPDVRFSWQMNDAAPNQSQTAYQIQVVADPLPPSWEPALLWDSGEWDPGKSWASQPSSLHIPYGGTPLAPNSFYWWRVRTWNARGEVGFWSEPQRFRTGAALPEPATARQHLVETAEAPVAVVRTGPEVTFVDFGRAAFGTVELTLDAAQACQVLVRLGEVRRSAYEIDRNPGGSRRFREVPLAVETGSKTYRLTIAPDPRNTATERDERRSAAIPMPSESPEVLPFRYCEVEGAAAPLRRDQVKRVSVWYPFDEEAAAFRSSSSVLNDVWELCKYSMKATSFCGVHVDGDRERIPYEADAYINQLGYYCCDSEYALSRYTHEYLIRNPTWPTEWVLFSVLLAWEDYQYTGDPASMARFYNDLEAKTLTALARQDGLISTAGDKVTPEVAEAIHIDKLRDIVDWPQGERDGYDMRPVNTVVNAFHWRALVLMGRMAAALGKADDATRYAARAAKVRDSMLTKLVDPQSGLFVDGEESRHSALHATVFPLAFGLTPPEMMPAAVALIRERGLACSVYAAQLLLEALYRAGAADEALALMTSRAERGWAHWVYDVESTVTLEAWDDRFKPNQDWNHAWGGAPANIIPRFLVGVRPLTPGFGRILIQPQPGGLCFVEARVPTIRGPVAVTIRQESGRSMHLEIDIPANASARVVLAGRAGRTAEILLDGSPCIPTMSGADLVVDPVGSGRHALACRI